MKKYFPTEIGLLAIWDEKSLGVIDTEGKYGANFVNDKDLLALMNQGKAVIWGTGGDGFFSVDVRVNPEIELSEKEKKLVEIEASGLKLVVTSEKVLVGSPEAVATIGDSLQKQGVAVPVEGVAPGNYLVDVYFLFDGEAMELDKQEFEKKLKENPDFDKTGFVLILKSVPSDYVFTPITELPQLG